MGQSSSSPHKRLRKEDVEFLRKNTRYDEQTIQEWYKGFMIDCPHGRLTPESFLRIYSKFFPTGNAEDFCRHIFRTFDADQNGFIDFKEFLLAVNVTAAGSPEEKLDWAFSMYDLDGNGWIDLIEMTKMVKSIYKLIGPEQERILTSDHSETPEKKAAEIFRKMDLNNDGRITREEFIQTCTTDNNLVQLLSPNLQL